jgi:DNA invertase Pin-like site-specific DNA recombinase
MPSAEDWADDKWVGQPVRGAVRERAAARGCGQGKGRRKIQGEAPTAQRRAAEVIQLRGQGVKPEEIAVKLGISRASVFRVLKDRREAAQS